MQTENAASRATLPADEVQHPVPPEKLPCCKCGGVHSRELPDNESDQFEYIEGHFRRIHHVRKVLACTCGESIVQGPAPATVVDGSPYGPGIYAQVVVAKCADSIPLYRQSKMYARAGVTMDDSTLGELLHRAATVLAPLAAQTLVRIAKEGIVLADETVVRVQAKGKTRTAYVWAFLGAKLIAFKFSPSRSGETPRLVLGASTGTLVVDGYTGYNSVCTPEKRERSGCLAHARRKLYDCRSHDPIEVDKAMALILEVYRVEHEAKELGIARTEAHQKLRTQKSKPAMDKLNTWLQEQKACHLPSSPLGKAVGYCINQWSFLTVFLTNAGVPVDNNASERALRTYALGRKNWLFMGNDLAGERYAVLMTLVRSCEANGVNPIEYLRDVLMRIQDHPNSRIDELLPDVWQPPGAVAIEQTATE